MEKRKSSLVAVKMCRFCLTQSETLASLYERNRQPKSSPNLHLKILTCVSFEIYPSDKMPTFICERCKFFMNMFYEYKRIVRQADETILQYIQHGSPMEIINWPTALSNIYRNATKVVNTVIEDGTTVQVTSQDNSDSDDEDGNVYNIKIGDTPEDTKTACVKVITSKDEDEMEEPNAREPEEIEENQEKLNPEEEERCYPCDECECVYPLQQLLKLHKRQKHRKRTAECDQCFAKFYTKYDLQAHLLKHSDEMPFKCVACERKFKRLKYLKRHEKFVHADLPQQECPNCPATFLSIEELEEHQKRHDRIMPFNCTTCGRKFPGKASMQRHMDIVHNRVPTYCCSYCPERFGSVTKLARHVRSHAGERPFPCKHCNKTFLKSHHYTRHLRLKHRELFRPTGDYRCEQCDDTFAAQDDLIYHSAIHATQNLICPLCQEKFQDVDAVTTHIKSHVTGVEFMCDYCELVFTSKEKLENHLIAAHDDEVQNEVYLDESSMEIHDDDDDSNINVKDKGDHMLIEIKKPDDFMMTNLKGVVVEKPETINSEESETETTYTELSTVDTLAIVKKNSGIELVQDQPKPITEEVKTVAETKQIDIQTTKTQASILRKAEEVKRKAVTKTESTVLEKKIKTIPKAETTNSGGATDKSLRLLEKELQDLKRTNSRPEIAKNPIKTSDTLRSKRPQIHTSTPKPRMAEEKKLLLRNKSPAIEKKKELDKRFTKENKEPKESKETKNSNGGKEDTKTIVTKEDTKTISAKEDTKNGNSSSKEDEVKKDRDTPKSVNKNKSQNNKSASEDVVRRSTRPSKIKNYAKMIREQTQIEDDDDEDETSDEDEDYKEIEKSAETRVKSRRSSVVAKSSPKPAPTRAATPPAPASALAATPAPAAAPAVRKRGRPKKEPHKEVPAKIKKEDTEQKDNDKSEYVSKHTKAVKEDIVTDNSSNNEDKNVCKTPEQKPAPSELLVSPSGQTLKKVPIKALPPGVKPLPLPVNARPMGAGELCEMQIGKKVVKVQKIVMTKAEVEAMAKKGLVEMKDGTMVLKQGIKLPAVDSAIKSSIPTEGESTVKSDKAAPSRCDIEDTS